MTDSDMHAPDCARVLYRDQVAAGNPNIVCDCEASEPPQGLSPPDDAPQAMLTVVAGGPVATLVGAAAVALNAYRRAMADHRKAKARMEAALAALNEELAK